MTGLGAKVRKQRLSKLTSGSRPYGLLVIRSHDNKIDGLTTTLICGPHLRIQISVRDCSEVQRTLARGCTWGC